MFNPRRYPIDAYEASELSQPNLRKHFAKIDREIMWAANRRMFGTVVLLSDLPSSWWDDIIKAYSIRSFKVAREGDYLKLSWADLP